MLTITYPTPPHHSPPIILCAPQLAYTTLHIRYTPTNKNAYLLNKQHPIV